MRPDGCGDYMAIVGVGQANGGHQVLEPRDEGVADMRVHESPGAFETLGGQVRTVAEQRADPLVVDGLRPFRTEQVRDRKFEKKIAQGRRIEDGGVEEGDGGRRRSIAHAQFLGVGGEFVECPAPGVVRCVLVAAQILETHASVRADLAERDVSRFEEADEEGARDVEEVGGPLRGQFRVLAQHGDGAAGGHVVEDFQEELCGRCGQ